MRYTINKENYHSFHTIGVNRLGARSYFIPFATRREADEVPLNKQRYASGKVQCLSGKWDFAFYPQPAKLPDVLDTEKVVFETMDVPGCWQYRGYDKPFYINTRYQFPFDPPHIPKEEKVGRVFSNAGSDLGIKLRWQDPGEEYNFVGVYRKKFRIRGGSRQVLTFLGVASCMDVYVNGQFVGYSEGSHNMAEFDITSYVTKEENELLAVVHRWCTGTYLECQDMFRNNGIFRDVLLHEMDEADIWDVQFESRENSAKVTVWHTGQLKIRVSLCGHGISRHAEAFAQTGKLTAFFDNLNITKWTAEKPVLYDLYIQTEHSCVKLRVAFKDVRIEGDIFTLNGSKLKFKGVNHHDTNPRNGYAMTPAEIEADVRLCKEYNIDTIRTSHYPPDPLLLSWCDELGIYVVDEADLETHGVVTQQMIPNFNTLTHDPKWQKHYLDRVQRLYHRDKNHGCIVMWSLGNEAGGYRNTDAMYRWLKPRTTLPIHYESVIHSRRVAYDVGSEMYPSVEMVRQVGQHIRRQKPLNDRPYFLCEYAHAMGVGPGAAEEYWKEIYSYDNLMGGCVWEMVDHAVLQPDGSYTYGGDHGEWAHDGNFCVDGIFYPDRSPSTGAKIVKHLYRPIRIRHIEKDLYEIHNTMAFTSTGCFSIKIVFADAPARWFRVDVPPMTVQNVRLPGCEPVGVSVYAQVTDKRTGRVVSQEQLSADLPVLPTAPKTQGLPLSLEVAEGVVSLRKDGKLLRAAAPYTILYRAPTDNDRDFLLNTAMDDYLLQQEEILSTVVGDECVKIESRITCKNRIFLCTDTYEQCSEGILVTSQLQCLKGNGDLPRFGKAFRLDSRFDTVRWLGREEESYCDMLQHTVISENERPLRAMTEPNIKPQESGNRCDCAWVTLSDGETEFSIRAVGEPFELGVKPYSDSALVFMRHRKDEVRTGTYVTVSKFHMGIGTGSCGPTTLPQYRYDCGEEYTMQFILG